MSSVTTPIAGTVNYSWDAADNMTGEGATTDQYDAAGRMVSVNSGAGGSYGFDGDGKRVKKTESGVAVYYVRSNMVGEVAFEVQGSQGLLNRAYVYHGKTMIAQLSTDGNFYWLHKDHRNNGHKMTNTSGAVVYRGEFDPHGNTLLETGTTTLNSRKFTGHERDASGLDYANARMYEGTRGRFTSPDPIGQKAANLNLPQSLNRYAYVNNDPINFADPNGELSIDISFFLQSVCGGGYGAIYSDAFLSSGRIFCSDPGDKLTKQILEALGEYQRPARKVKGIRAKLSTAAQKDYESEKQSLLDFLGTADGQRCKDFLNSLRLDAAKVLDAINKQRPWDATKSTISQVDAGIVPVGHDDANEPVSAALLADGSSTRAYTAIYASSPVAIAAGSSVNDVFWNPQKIFGFSENSGAKPHIL